MDENKVDAGEKRDSFGFARWSKERLYIGLAIIAGIISYIPLKYAMAYFGIQI